MAYITSQQASELGGVYRAPVRPSAAKGFMIAIPLSLGLWAAIIWGAAQIV